MWANVDPEERDRALRMLRWLRVRVHLADPDGPGRGRDSSELYELLNSTDSLDPWPACRYGTAAWEYMRHVAALVWRSEHETACRDTAARLANSGNLEIFQSFIREDVT